MRFNANEEVKIVAVLYIYLVFGWCVDDDLIFIPDHGLQILQTDHHNVVHVKSSSEAWIKSLVEHMAEAGYELPRELPDATFKHPYWMPISD